MNGGFRIQHKGTNLRELLRDMPEVSEQSLKAGAVEWHEEIRPGHFTAEAHRRYAHAPRSRRYNARKRKYTGQSIDMVMSGDLMRRTELLKLRTSAKQAKIILPAGFNRRHPKSAVRMRDEITNIIPTDERKIVSAYESAANEMIAKTNTPETITIQ